MIPSSRDSSRKAATASSSVTDDVAHPARVAQVGVLGPDARVVEPGGDRVRLQDLPVLVLEHRRERAVQHALAPGRERGAVAAALEALAAGLDADQLDRLVRR